MKVTNIASIAIVVALLSGCDHQPESGFVRIANLNVLQIDSVSMIEEESGNDKMLLRIPCSAWLSVDWDEVSYDVSKLKKGKLTVVLPQPQVMSPKVHHEKEVVLDENRSLWTSASKQLNLKEKAEQRAQAEVAELAMSQDSVKTAKAQTVRLVECFYRQSSPGLSVSVEWKK
ncbi:MAG: DUF4230 domain-containing protein [Kiritimatiellia bacterium]